MKQLFRTDMTSLCTANCQIETQSKNQIWLKISYASSSSRQEKSERIGQSYWLFSNFPSLLKFKAQGFPRSKVMSSNFILNQDLWKFVQTLLEPMHSNYSHSTANYRCYEEILFCFKFLPSCILHALLTVLVQPSIKSHDFIHLHPEVFSSLTQSISSSHKRKPFLIFDHTFVMTIPPPLMAM